VGDEEGDHHMLRCRSLAVLAVGAVLALAGCGGGGGGGDSAKTTTSAGASGPGTSTTVDAAARYQAAVRRAETATCAFNKGVAALGPDPRVKETKSLVPPVTAALRRFRRDLGAIPWPAAAKRDATNLQKATDSLVSDIQTLPEQSPKRMPSWTATTQKDKARFAGITRSLRAKIGLLPLAAETCV
jgi:hypothetical protein